MKIRGFSFVRNLILLVLGLQIVFFVIAKQRFAELERKNQKLENEINQKMNQNNLLKIKLTELQNDYRIRKLGEKYLPEYKPFKPNQIIELQNI